ncbi:MAG: TonB-dependent receptor [Ignavibacteriales bacterium]|nr:TonB-dependent receptor [Ignavibacteriales bacterium]
MKSIICLITLFSVQFITLAQTHNLKLIVLNSENNLPITDANLELSGNYFGTTNNSGQFVFENIPNGNYKLKVSHISYKTFESNISNYADTTITIQLIPGNIKLGEVVVTSGKYEQNIQLLPYSVSVVDQKEIQNSSSVTISELLNRESGISLVRDGIWGTEVSIRGLSRANVATLIDGNRIETSTDLSARLSMFDLNDVERIEVIKGSASSLYGSGATGGAINIISKSGSYSDRLMLNGNYSLGYNSVNNYISNGINLLASGNEWIAKLSGSFRKASNTKTPSGELSNSQFEDNSFNVLIQLKPFEDQEIKFNYQQFYAYDVGIPGGAPLFPNNAKVSYPEELRRLLSAEYKINNLNRSLVKLSAKYFHQFISRDVENIPGIVQYAPAGNGQPFRRLTVLKISPGADHNTDGFQTQADFKFSSHYIIAGIDFWKRNYDGLRTRDQKIEILNAIDSSVVKTIYKTTYEKPLPDADFSSAGIYLQDEMNLLKYLYLTIGGRYDFISLSNSETLNPLYETNDGVVNNTPAGQKVIWNAESANNKSYVFNLGLLYSLNDNSNISLNAARSFRSPSLEERYQYIDLGSVIRVGDPNLKPEQGYFFDFGFRLFPDNFNLTASVFFNSLTDLVTEISGTYESRSALIKTNIGEALLYGFEYSIYFKLLNKFNFYNTLSYVRGLNKKDDQDLPQISPLNSILGFEYSPFNCLNVDLYAALFAEQNKVAPGEIATPGYATFNLKLNFASIELGNIKTGVVVGVENIFDKEYRNHLSTNRGLIVSEPGRNIFVRVNLTF